MRLLSSFILGFLMVTLTAEDAAPVPANPKTLEAQRKAAAQQRVDELLKKKPVLYSGFATDMSRSTNVSKTLNLRQPNRSEEDLTNLLREDRTNRPKGYKIWAVSF